MYLGHVIMQRPMLILYLLILCISHGALASHLMRADFDYKRHAVERMLSEQNELHKMIKTEATLIISLQLWQARLNENIAQETSLTMLHFWGEQLNEFIPYYKQRKERLIALSIANNEKMKKLSEAMACLLNHGCHPWFFFGPL